MLLIITCQDETCKIPLRIHKSLFETQNTFKNLSYFFIMSGLLAENKFFGLFQGPVDHNASSVINAIFDVVITTRVAIIGEAVFWRRFTSQPDEILPQVLRVGVENSFYGIIVGGDQDGIYPRTGDDFFLVDTIAALPGGNVRVCTQGRCIAFVDNQGQSYNVGDPLMARNGHLIPATTGDLVVARALQKLDAVGIESFAFIAVDVQREGILP